MTEEKLVVEVITTAKSGRSLRVKCGEEWFGAAKGSNLESAKGKAILAEVDRDGEWGPWIKTWNLAPSLDQPMKASPTVGSTSPWWMPFVSNTVAHAIAAGKIERPEDVGTWARAAMHTAIALDNEADDVPF